LICSAKALQLLKNGWLVCPAMITGADFPFHSIRSKQSKHSN